MRRSIIDQWELEVLPYPIYDPRSPCIPYGGANPSSYRWKNGGITYVFGVQEAQSMLGARFDAGYVCQAEQLTLKDWEFLSHRCGRAANWLDENGEPIGQIWADANPDASQHWIRKRIDDGIMESFTVGFKDNITFFQNGEWTNHGLNRTALLKNTISGISYRRLILGEWTSAEGAVFPEFNEEDHVINTLPEDILHWSIYQGIDYGHSASTSCVWIAHNQVTDEMIAFKEWSKTNTLIEDHITAIKRHSIGMDISLRVCDHDAQMNHQLDAAGLGTENAQKDAGSVLRGLDLMRLRLRNKTLKFYKHMLIEPDYLTAERNLPKDAIEEMGLYVHKPIEKHIGDSTKDDIPMTGQSDHRIDAIRYVIDKVDRSAPLEIKTSIATINRDNWTR